MACVICFTPLPNQPSLRQSLCLQKRFKQRWTCATSCREHPSRRQRVVLFERWKAVCNIPAKVKWRTGPNIPVILQWFLMPTKIKVDLRTQSNLHLQAGKQNNTFMIKPLQNHNHNPCLYGKILQQERIALNHNQPSWNKTIRCCCMRMRNPLSARGVEVVCVCVFHGFKYNSNFQLDFFGWSGGTWKSLNVTKLVSGKGLPDCSHACSIDEQGA